MRVRKTNPADHERVGEIYENAKRFMREAGNPNQWNDGKPNIDTAREDMERGVGYVADGDTGHHVNMEGYDEITALSRSVEQMRVSILAKIESERKAIEANSELITSMSHDIRTPLTVLLGYIDMMKERSEDIKIIGVEPAASPLITEGHAGPHKLQGIGANFIPSIFDPAMTDLIITATAEDSYALAREIGSMIGIGVGISSGAALFAAIEVARRDEASGKTVVAICPDGIDRYLSTDLFE